MLSAHLGGLFQRLDGLVLLLELGPVQVVHALRRPHQRPLRIMILEMALQGKEGRERLRVMMGTKVLESYQSLSLLYSMHPIISNYKQR